MRGFFPIWLIWLFAGSLLCLPARAQPIAVEATGELPGFRIADAPPWLAHQMDQSGVAGWQFIPRDPGKSAPDRVEWRFSLLPYAGGTIRQFMPMPGVRLGRKSMVAAEARLFLDGQFQAAAIGQEAVLGGDTDPDLGAMIMQMARSLQAAWLAIDMTPAEHRAAH